MKESIQPRNPAVLSESIQRWLGMYALSATAAGVGMLAQAQPAEAKIVYTPSHVVVKLDHSYCVDTHIDRTQVFCLIFTGHEGGCYAVAHGSIAANHSGRGALPIRGGEEIGQSKHFANGSYYPSMGTYYCANPSVWRGQWVVGGKGLKNRYLGVRFQINGKNHYGWARCSLYTKAFNGAIVMTGYAYETTPNKPIIAGKTKGQDVITVPESTNAGTLGHLALGRK